MPTVDPATLLETLLSTSEFMASTVGLGSLERRDGYVVNEAVMPMPEINGMFVHGPEQEAAIDDMPALRERFLADGRPFGVTTIDGRTASVEAAAAALGLAEASRSTAMTLVPSSFRREAVAGVRVERVRAADADVWVEVVADGFEAPPEVFGSVLTPSMLDVFDEPWIGALIGWLDDVPVSTACFLVREGGVSIVNVATPPAYRGQGYAGAVTSDAIERGLAAGGTFAWLEASPMGLSLYERLGFEPLWSSTCRAEPETGS